jgi:hypothetical protein
MSALENLKKYGNFWGAIQYSVDKTYAFPWFAVRFEIRSKENVMGRFGGGWNYKIGFQFSRLSYVLIHFGVGTLTLSFGKERASDARKNDELRKSRRVAECCQQ